MNIADANESDYIINNSSYWQFDSQKYLRNPNKINNNKASNKSYIFGKINLKNLYNQSKLDKNKEKLIYQNKKTI